MILTMTGYESQAGEYVQSHGISKGTILGGVGLISDDSVCAIYAIHTLRDMAMVYHNATNFGYQKVEYTREDLEDWYEVIWAGWQEELNRDVDGGGTVDTVSLGFIPISGR